MKFKMPYSPNDEKLFQDDENFFTMGRGSYGVGILLSNFTSKQNILVGRFSSCAVGLFFLICGTHSINSVATSPFDNRKFVRTVLGDIPTIPNIYPHHQQVIIGSDVYIGRDVTIMGGVKIGNGAVIGAKAVVAKDIPPYAIAVGNPARVVKYRFDAETIKKFLAVKWWNWSLEKIADNFPLMNDVEKFLAAHYSPELAEFPEDDFSRQLNAVGGGVSTYHFVPDFQAKSPLWKRVVQEFCQSNAENSRLVIWLGKDTSDDDAKALTEAGGANPNIITFKQNFSPCAVRQGTHFITTREMSTLEVMDYLWDTDVKIVSALDNGIFD